MPANFLFRTYLSMTQHGVEVIHYREITCTPMHALYQQLGCTVGETQSLSARGLAANITSE